mmetsp:Transcript_98133/g.158223  ORF Transcript_98133/g.158223 Transcript_98133/m.158223 type:complete len:102 (+) Transcript_98133:165-470(+)
MRERKGGGLGKHGGICRSGVRDRGRGYDVGRGALLRRCQYMPQVLQMLRHVCCTLFWASKHRTCDGRQMLLRLEVLVLDLLLLLLDLQAVGMLLKSICVRV